MIRVNLVSLGHSAGRGVGFYTENLARSLKNIGEIILTNNHPDIVHYPFFDLFYHTLPILKIKPTIVTIHDVTPLVLSQLYPLGIKSRFFLPLQKLALKSVKAVITDSQNSKNDIIKYLSVPSDKIFVIPLAADSVYAQEPKTAQLNKVKTKYQLPDKFILTVAGGPNPNKNLPALAEVTAKLKLPLVIVGQGMLQELKYPINPELQDLAELKHYSHLIYPGFVHNEDLNAIYHLATLYVQPSLYEGFGLPLLEAMTASCLVVSSSTSSLKEIYHEGAITFDPKSVDSMKSAIKKALGLPSAQRQIQIKQAKIKAHEFDWQKTAENTVKVYRRILKP